MSQLTLFDGVSTRPRGMWRSRRPRSDVGVRKRWQTVKCAGCGASFEVPHHVVQRGRKFCSNDCRRKHQQQPGRPRTGTTNVDNNGYVRTYAPSYERPPGWKSSRVLEHRLVMSRLIGRPLLKTETVHHINGDKTDNRPVNPNCIAGNTVKTCVTDVAHAVRTMSKQLL